VAASPIDPSDRLILRGHYPVLPSLPAVPGQEGAGVVHAVGAGVDPEWIGRLVLLPMRSQPWRPWTTCVADQALALPDGLDPVQACMLRINPPTAWLLLEGLQPGDWVVQSPGTGGVGHAVVQLAQARGIRTVSWVSSAERGQALLDAGGDVVLEEVRGVGRATRAAVDGPIVRALDGAAGSSTERLARCLGPGGQVWVYGGVRQQPASLSVAQMVFREISLRGFWLYRWNLDHPEQRDALLLDLAERMVAGTLRLPVAATMGLEQLDQALELAGSRPAGRVVLTP
jgi:NADPH:quinone reductase-like Zn-dependent oxidoreductase